MTDQSGHERFQHLLGAYVLGGLDPADRAAADAHVLTCTECRRELAEFAVVPGLLSRLPATTTAPAVSGPSPALQGSLRSMSASRRTRRRFVTAGLVGLAACTMAAGIGIGSVLTRSDGSPAGPPQAPVQQTVQLAANVGSLGGSADLAAKPWGTELRLKLHDLPAAERLEVVAIGADGRSEPAATWSVPENGEIQLTGATSIRQEAVRRIDIRTDEGEVLASSAP